MIGVFRKYSPGRIVAVVAIAFIVAVVGIITFWRLSLAADNRARLKAIAARGEPTNSWSLNQSYQPVPDAENAAVAWLNGVRQITGGASVSSTWNKFKLPARGAPIPADQLEFARGIVKSNEIALMTFRQAAALSKSRYPVDLTPGVNALLPHLSPMKQVAHLLQAETLVALEERDSRRAVGAIKTILAESRSLASEPLLISQLVSYAIDTIAFNTTEFVLNGMQLNDGELQELSTAFAKADDTNRLPLALIGERAIFIGTLQNPQALLTSAAGPGSSSSGADAFTELTWPLIRLTGFFERDFGFGMDALTTNIALARLPDPQRFIARTNWDVVEARAHENHYVLSGLLLPAFAKAITRDTDNRARARVAQVVMAVERHRLAHNGELPDTTATLAPNLIMKIPADPFDGQPLRFKRLESGYMVYSVGPDAEDDGGKERPAKLKEKERWDTTFIVERK
jgi:hypothetical protein